MGCYLLLQGIFLTEGLNLHLVSLALAGGFFTTGATWKAYLIISLNLLICLMHCSYFFVGFFFLLPCSSIFLVFVQLGYLSIFSDVK